MKNDSFINNVSHCSFSRKPFEAGDEALLIIDDITSGHYVSIPMLINAEMAAIYDIDQPSEYAICKSTEFTCNLLHCMFGTTHNVIHDCQSDLYDFWFSRLLEPHIVTKETLHETLEYAFANPRKSNYPFTDLQGRKRQNVQTFTFYLSGRKYTVTTDKIEYYTDNSEQPVSISYKQFKRDTVRYCVGVDNQGMPGYNLLFNKTKQWLVKTDEFDKACRIRLFVDNGKTVADSSENGYLYNEPVGVNSALISLDGFSDKFELIGPDLKTPITEGDPSFTGIIPVIRDKETGEQVMCGTVKDLISVIGPDMTEQLKQSDHDTNIFDNLDNVGNDFYQVISSGVNLRNFVNVAYNMGLPLGSYSVNPNENKMKTFYETL